MAYKHLVESVLGRSPSIPGAVIESRQIKPFPLE
jgi:hypothetical protein